METISPHRLYILSLLSGDPTKSLEDARHILYYLRRIVAQQTPVCDLKEMEVRDGAIHTLFSADLYLFGQQMKAKRHRSDYTRWAGYHRDGRCR
jgi:hypothetical protein